MIFLFIWRKNKTKKRQIKTMNKLQKVNKERKV